jgi:hypothetical protein
MAWAFFLNFTIFARYARCYKSCGVEKALFPKNSFNFAGRYLDSFSTIPFKPSLL